MTQIKICGVTRAEDVLAAKAAGAHCIGINFYPPSPRYIGTLKCAEELASVARRAQLNIAGVFVNSDEQQIIESSKKVGIEILQFHGDETPEFVERISKLLPLARKWKALRSFDEEAVRKFADADCDILFDASVPGLYGGSGTTIDWTKIPKLKVNAAIIVSGGLTPENVAEAVRIARPDWVDTASGVESSPGIKDIQKLRAFCAAIQNPKSRI